MSGGLESVSEDGLRLLGSVTMEDQEGNKSKGDWTRPLSAEKMVHDITGVAVE